MKVDQPFRMALLCLVAVAIWIYNFGLFQSRSGAGSPSFASQDASWDLRLDERLKILAKQKLPDLPTMAVNPFFPNTKLAQPEQGPILPPEPEKIQPIFAITYLGMVSGDGKETILLKCDDQLRFVSKGAILGEWVLQFVFPDKLVFVSGEFTAELMR